MPFYRRKPVIVEAVRNPVEEEPRDEDIEAMHQLLNDQEWEGDRDGVIVLYCDTDSAVRVVPGDWLVRGPRGTVTPYKPAAFEARYERLHPEP